MPPPEAMRSAGAGYETLHGDGDGGGGEHRGGGDQIGQGSTGLAEARDEFDAVLLAAGALGRLAAVVRVAQQRIQQRPVDVSRCGDFAAAIAVQFPGGELACESVDHHVAGSGIESDDIFGRAGGRDHGDVGDAADVERHAGAARMAEEQVIDERHQGRALAAGGDIAGAEVGHHGDAGALGEDGRLAELERVGAAFVEDGLSVAADEFHRAEALHGGQHGARVELRRAGNSSARWHAVWVGQLETPRMAARTVGGSRALQVKPMVSTLRAADVDDGDIDAVERGAAHDSGDSHDRLSSFCNSLSSCRASMGRSSSRLRPRMRSAMP